MRRGKDAFFNTSDTDSAIVDGDDPSLLTLIDLSMFYAVFACDFTRMIEILNARKPYHLPENRIDVIVLITARYSFSAKVGKDPPTKLAKGS